LVGHHLVRALLDGGHEVVVLDDFSSGKRERLPGSVVVVHGNVTDQSVVQRALKGCDHVVHLAALVSVPLSLEQPQKTFMNNVAATQILLDVARQAAFKGWIIYASSAAVYGGLDQPKALERDAAGAVLLSPYAASKAMGEALGQMYGEVYGLRTLGLRFFNIYGPGQDAKSPYSGVLSRVVDCVEMGKVLPIFGDGQQTRDFVAVADVAGVIKALLERPVERETPTVMNLGSGAAASLLEMIGEVEVVKGRRLQVEHQAARAGDIRLSCADIGLLRSVLPEWQPLTLREGLRRWLG
jgi:UDP-glucose 4-epimerase